MAKNGQSDTTSLALSLADAGSAITSLLSVDDTPEDKQIGEADHPIDDESLETVEPEATDDDEQLSVDDGADDDVDDEDEEEQTTTPEPRKLKVKLPEGEQELPEEEVVKGYLRTADYTRKSQENAERRKALDAETQAVTAERQRYATQLAQLDALLTDATGDEPDWDALRNEDPAVFAATYAAWDQQQKRVQAVRNERQRAEQQVQADNVERLKAHVAAETEKLVEAIPEWKNPESAKAEQVAIAEYARSQGYTDQDLGAVTDHRLVKILRDAMLYRKAQAKKPSIEQKIEKAKVLAPGSSVKPKVVTAQTKAKQRLAKTGSLRDAGSAIALLLDDE